MTINRVSIVSGGQMGSGVAQVTGSIPVSPTEITYAV